MRFSVRLALLGVFLVGVTVWAQGPFVGPIGPLLNPGTAGLTRVGQATESMIHGTAVDANARPLPNISVRLRNLESTKIEQVSRANEVGEFTFIAKPEVPYVVEVADEAGHIIAVGDVITAQAGDVAGAMVIIPTRLPAIAGVFGESAGSVVSAATGTGLTALDATVAPLVSPER
jgi:hypothetical protein